MPHPVQEPITGREDLGEPGSPLQALARFYRAFNARDLTLMATSWEPSDDVAMDNPLGGIARGWPAIRAVYERIFASPARVRVEFHDYTLHVAGELFYAVGRERGTFEMAGGTLNLAIRTTRIFRWTGNGWRQVHHHGSMDDSGLLGAYQRVVRAGAAAAPISAES